MTEFRLTPGVWHRPNPATVRCNAKFDNLIKLILIIKFFNNKIRRRLLPTDMQRKRFFYKQNRLKQLRAFCYTAQSCSFTRAAERMFLSQPSISLLIKSLEKDLGKSLFRRNGPRTALTEHGKILLQLALPLVEGLENLTELFNERCTSTVGGRLAIAASDVAALYILPTCIKEFRQAYPEAELVIDNVSEKTGMEKIHNGSTELFFGPLVDVPAGIIFIPTHAYASVLITAPDHPLARQKNISISDIGKYDLILPALHQPLRQMINRVFLQHGVEYSVALEVSNPEVIKKYVETGMGIAIIASICLSGKEKLHCIQLQDNFPKMNYGLILRRGKILSPAGKQFIEMITAGANAQIAALRDHIVTQGT